VLCTTDFCYYFFSLYSFLGFLSNQFFSVEFVAHQEMSRTGSPHIDTLCITSLPGGIEKVLFWYMSILFLPHVSPWRATLSRDPSQ